MDKNELINEIVEDLNGLMRRIEDTPQRKVDGLWVDMLAERLWVMWEWYSRQREEK